jgi:hypothetical protein
MGEFVFESRNDRDGRDLSSRVVQEINEDWPLLRGGGFGGDADRARNWGGDGGFHSRKTCGDGEATATRDNRADVRSSA